MWESLWDMVTIAITNTRYIGEGIEYTQWESLSDMETILNEIITVSREVAEVFLL